MAIFLSVSTGLDSNSGTMTAPVKSFTRALELAKTNKSPYILVAAGTYSGSVKLEAGISFYGGYGTDWVREDVASAFLRGSVAPMSPYTVTTALLERPEAWP